MARTTAQRAEDPDIRDLNETLTAIVKRAGSLLEEENFHHLRLSIDAPLAYLAPWENAESVFSQGQGELPLDLDDITVQRFLKRFAKGRLAYGYPVFVDIKGSAWPLFTLRARLSGDGENITVESSETAHINVSLLRARGVDESNLKTLCRTLREDSPTFQEAMALACDALAIDPERFASTSLDQVVDGRAQPRADGWWNRPILMPAPFSGDRRFLWNDIVAMLRAPLSQQLSQTALAGLIPSAAESSEAAVPEDLDGPMIFDIHSLGPSQTQAVRSAMTNPLTVVETPPGTGQMAAIVNMVATAVMNGQTVLYVAARRDSVVAMATHLESCIGRKHHVIMRMGSARTISTMRKRIIDAAYRIARQDANDDDGDDDDKKQKRDKPTRRLLDELDRATPMSAKAVDPIREAHDKILELYMRERERTVELGRAWTGPASRKAPLPATKAALADLRKELDECAGQRSPGLSKMVKQMLARNDRRKDMVRAITKTLGKLPSEVRDDIMGDAEEQTDWPSLYAVLDRLDRYCAWRSSIDDRLDATRKLMRAPDSRTLELQQLNQAAQKSSGARELFRDDWQDRLTSDPTTLDKQLRTYFETFDRRVRTREPESESQLKRRIVQAINGLAKTLPIWTSRLLYVPATLPLSPGLFDLVIVDEVDRMELASILPLILRGKRACLVGAARRYERVAPMPEKRMAAVLRGSKDAPSWTDAVEKSALGMLRALADQSFGVHLLRDHFRSHPFIADYLARTFYDGQLTVRTNYRALRNNFEGCDLGLFWHDAEGRIERQGGAPANSGEVAAATELIFDWYNQGVFDSAPKKSVAVVTPLPAQIEMLRRRLGREKLPDPIIDRLLIATPDAFIGRPVDILIVMPGLAPEADPDFNAALAGLEVLYHDAVGAARGSLHVVGDYACCSEAGSYASALAEYVGPPFTEEPEPVKPADEFETRFDDAFGSMDEVAVDYLTPLRQLLDDVGLPYQANVQDRGVHMTFRVLSPHGGLYNIEMDLSKRELDSQEQLDRAAKRDQKAVELGYQVLRFEPEEIIEKANFILERLQRMA